jgi:hypothetical protein
MGTSYDVICDRWLDNIFGRTTKPNFSTSHKVYALDDRIFSYGTHFEMARVLRDRASRPRGFLLNGDWASHTTARHQSVLRAALSREKLPRVIIPYSALAAAGVEYDTVEIIHVTEDGHETIDHVSYEQPPGSQWRQIDDHAYVDLSPDELAAKVAQRNRQHQAEWERHKRWADEGDTFWQEHLAPEPRVITEADLGSWDRREYRKVGSHMELFKDSRTKWNTVKVNELDDGRTRYTWTTHRHWLGESLIRARVRMAPKFTPCEACDGTGQGPADPDSEADRRWGPPRCEQCRGQRGTSTPTRGRWAYFLSGFDRNETRRVYFFCELPRGAKPTTVDEAYEDLKPDAVKVAEQMGRTVQRQGDIFAIELRGLTKRALRTRGARFEKRGNLLNTNHEATEVAYLPNGTTLVRGTLWHNPQWRGPDHKRVTVGKSWHLTVKNTVPVSA